MSPAEAGRGQELAPRLTGYGQGPRPVALRRESTRAHENRVEHRYRPRMAGPTRAVTEWFVNRPGGVEHGFFLPEPPPVDRQDEPLRLEMPIEGAY